MGHLDLTVEQPSHSSDNTINSNLDETTNMPQARSSNFSVNEYSVNPNVQKNLEQESFITPNSQSAKLSMTNNSFFKSTEQNGHLTHRAILGGGIGLCIGVGVAVGFGLAATSSLLVAASGGVGVCLVMLALALFLDSVYQAYCASPSNA